MSNVFVVQRDLAQGYFRITAHARQRMRSRNVTVEDVKACAMDGLIIAENDNYKVVGLDTKDEDLTIICAYLDSTLIVTVI